MPDEPPASFCVQHFIVCRGDLLEGLTCYEDDLAFQAREVLILDQNLGHCVGCLDSVIQRANDVCK